MTDGPFEQITVSVLAHFVGLPVHVALQALNRVEAILLDLPNATDERPGGEVLPIEGLIDRRTRSKIERDPELRVFVHHLGRMSFKQMATRCRERFGPARAPSRSALHRYAQRVVRLRKAFLQDLVTQGKGQ